MMALYKHGDSPAALPIAIAGERLAWIDDQLADAEGLVSSPDSLRAAVEALYMLIARLEKGDLEGLPIQLGVPVLQTRAAVLRRMLGDAENDQDNFDELRVLQYRHEAQFRTAVQAALHD